MLNLRRVSACLLAAATTATFQVAFSPVAHAGTFQAKVVSTVPAAFTPDITDGTVYSINQVGSRIIVGGIFTSVAAHNSATTVPRSNVFAFDAATGAIDPGFAPALDGDVQGVEPGPTANTVYLAGFFNTVNGVKSKSITLLDTTTGAIVTGFKPPAFNGAGWAAKYANGRLYVGGTFSTVGGVAHSGLVALNPTTGALTSYVNVQLTGHHNYNGTGANGAVGPRAMSISPNGNSLIVIGNFKNADGVVHDQIVWMDLTGATAAVRSDWNTLQYTAACFRSAFDTYMRGIDWAPDGSYFVIVATGGSGTNSDSTTSLCDAAARFEAGGSGSNVKPTWVDYTGQDTLLSVAITGTAVYVGGHERWLNNSNAKDHAGTGAVPRPGMAALDPANGLPLAWNPGRNPRGAGAYAMFASADGVYVGSDTDWFGNFGYKRKKIGFFPLAGGTTPASTATQALPANVYMTGPLVTPPSTYYSDLVYRPFSGVAPAGARTIVAGTGIDWSTTRGAFMAGNTIFYGTSTNKFFQASFDGTTVGTPVAVDPYNDPTWSAVDTGSGQTYQGTINAYYGQLGNVTGAFFDRGRMYYTVINDAKMHYRYFTPDSGIIGATQFDATGGSFAKAAGEFVSGTSLYYANSTDGTLHRTTFTNGVISGTDTVVSGPAVDGTDWRARSLFAYGDASFPNQAPTAVPAGSCANLACSFDGSGSSDPDGTVATYAWDFGDGSTGTGVTPTHGYAGPGDYTVTLTVTDNRGTQSPPATTIVTATAPVSGSIGFVAAAHSVSSSTTSATVTTPAAVAAGDTELLFVTANTANVTGAPAGWTPVTTLAPAPLQVTVFRRTVVAGDGGTTVTVPISSASGVALQLLDYSNVDAASITFAGATNTTTTASHTAPAIAVSATGSVVVSFWSDRSSTTTGWTLPPAVDSRDVVVGTGGGHVSAAVGDKAAGTGTYPAQTATTNAAGSKGAMLTIVLTPAG